MALAFAFAFAFAFALQLALGGVASEGVALGARFDAGGEGVALGAGGEGVALGGRFDAGGVEASQVVRATLHSSYAC
eukprot:14395236-Alexandrium_andersonii.AAC.1